MYVKVEDLKPPYVLARDVVDEKCRVLLRKGNGITDKVKEVIQQKGYKGVYVEDAYSDSICRKPLIDILDEFKIIQLLENIYKNKEYHENYYEPRFRVDLKNLDNEITILVDKLCSKKQTDDLIVELEDMRNQNNYLLWHSLSVCILSISTGIEIGLPRAILQELGVAAVLHDMGKSWLPDELLLKDKLSKSEKKELRKHPDYMFRVIQNSAYSYKVGQGIRMHHEKVDGTGYPNGLRGEKIVDFARIIAIADKFDNLINKGSAIAQSDAIEYLCGSSKYDTDFVRSFIKIAAPYPVGSKVMLSNGLTGVVIRNNVSVPLRPIIATHSGVMDLADTTKYTNLTVVKG